MESQLGNIFQKAWETVGSAGIENVVPNLVFRGGGSVGGEEGPPSSLGELGTTEGQAGDR